MNSNDYSNLILSKRKEIGIDLMTNKDITISWDRAAENMTDPLAYSKDGFLKCQNMCE